MTREPITLTQALPLLPWMIPSEVQLFMPSAAGGEPEIRYQPPTEGNRRWVGPNGILSAFLALTESQNPMDVCRFVERFGPLYLDEDGLVVAHFSNRSVHSPESVQRIRYYATVARALREVGLHLAARRAGSPPPHESVALMSSAVHDYMDALNATSNGRAYRLEPWLWNGVIPQFRGARREELLARADPAAARLEATVMLRTTLNWWLGMKRVGPWFTWPGSGPIGGMSISGQREWRPSGARIKESVQFRPKIALNRAQNAIGQPNLGLYGSAWGAIGLQLAQEILGYAERKIVFCDVGQHFFDAARYPPRGCRACCPRKKCRAKRNREYQAALRQRR
jgi:hypothetical protein